MTADRTPPPLVRGPYGGCWEWTGSTSRGYGTVRVGGRVVYVHRLAYAAIYGEIPAGMNACHRCDNPPCWRPDHMFLGTQADNMADMVAKGRRRSRALRGEQNGSAKLTDAEAQAILERWPAETQTALANEYGVSQSTIHLIVSRKIWDVVGSPVRKVKTATTHCVHGHAFTPENTIIRRSGGRNCRTCKNERRRR